jgi:hypothetical protein
MVKIRGRLKSNRRVKVVWGWLVEKKRLLDSTRELAGAWAYYKSSSEDPYEPVSVLADRLNTLLTALPSVGSTAIAARAMKTNKRAYSTRSCPSSSLRSFCSMSIIVLVPLCVDISIPSSVKDDSVSLFCLTLSLPVRNHAAAKTKLCQEVFALLNSRAYLDSKERVAGFNFCWSNNAFDFNRQGWLEWIFLEGRKNRTRAHAQVKAEVRRPNR